MTTIERLWALLAEATPGPWIGSPTERWLVSKIVEATSEEFGITTTNGSLNSRANAALIVAAVNALPALLDEMEHRREAMRIETWCPVCESTRCKFDPPDPDSRAALDRLGGAS